MTFYEAALEVLRRSGRPLHFKKITEFAIRDALLSHIGKTPEQTMGARLELELKREDESWLVRTRPGVFMLREDILARLNEEAAARKPQAAGMDEDSSVDDVEADFEDEEEVAAAPTRPAPARPAPAPPVAVEADSDDEDEEDEGEEAGEESADGGAQASSEGGRNGRRRRRRRGRRGNREDRGAEAPAAQAAPVAEVTEEPVRPVVAAVTGAPVAAAAAPTTLLEERQPRRTRGERNGHDNGERAQALAQEAILETVREERREHREPREHRDDRRHRRDDRRDDRREERGAREERPEREERPNRRDDRREERRDDRREERREDKSADLSGRFDSVGEAAFAVLKASGRKPMSAKAIADTVFQRKLVKFHTHDPAATVQAAMVADNQLRHGQGRRQVFANYGNGQWGLTEWGLSEAGIQKERQIQKLAQDLRDDASLQLANMLSGLKTEAFEMVVLAVLERLNYRNVRVSKRTSDGDAFFTADWRNGFTEARVCIQVVGDAEAEVDAEDIQLLRDTLQHYNGTEGVLIHMGDVARDAYRETKSANAARVSILDRETLVKLMVQEGIGVRHHQVSVAMVDTAFIESLKV